VTHSARVTQVFSTGPISLLYLFGTGYAGRQSWARLFIIFGTGYAGRQSWARLFIIFGTGYAGRQSWARLLIIFGKGYAGRQSWARFFIIFGTGYAGRQSWARLFLIFAWVTQVDSLAEILSLVIAIFQICPSSIVIWPCISLFCSLLYFRLS
jgi:hypothetical protein